MWKSYCPNAQVFGLDIDPACKRFSDARTTITIGSQSDPVALEAVVREAGGFDVIIDDGSHVNHHIIASFKRLWPHLRLGGLYAIEDLASSYAPLEDDNIRQQWPGMAYNRADDNLNNRREELDAFFNHLLHDLDHDRGHVLSVQFWPYLCLILKTQVSGEPSAATF